MADEKVHVDQDLQGNKILNGGFEVVDSLPTTNNFVGRQVTYQGRSYIWNGSAWKCDSDYLEIGGRNLVLGTKDLIGFPYRTEDKYLGFNIQRCTKIANEYVDLFSTTTINIPSELEYIVSFYAKVSINSQIACFFYSPNTTILSENSQGFKSTSVDGYSVLNVTTQWEKYWVKWKQTETTSNKNIIIGRNGAMPDGSILEICGVKLEKGNIATDWTPAPEDKADNSQSVNYALSSEQIETTTIVKDTPTLWQNIFSHTNFLWGKLKDLFTPIPLSVNDGYLTKIDDVNKKIVKSNINDNGDRISLEKPLRVNAKTFYNVAQYNHIGSGNTTGAIYIEMPFGWSYNMGTYEIDFYHFNNNSKAKIIVSGYNYGGNAWLNPSVQILGNLLASTRGSNVVRLGYNANTGVNKCCILIGNTNTIWDYPQVYVSKVTQGEFDINDWSTGWNISIITDESNITNIVQPTANVGMMLDGKTLTQQIADNDLRYLSLTAKAADSDKLDGWDSKHFGYYSNETLGDNVDFNTIPYKLDELLHTQPIHVPNYTGQLNHPFNEYGQLITFGGQGGVFPVQFAISDTGGGTEFLYRCQYRTTETFSFTKFWTRLWHSNNFDPATKLDTTTINGTQNYITKYGATGITQSNIFDNGTNVGIGTDAPNASYKLDVNGVIRGTNITSDGFVSLPLTCDLLWGGGYGSNHPLIMGNTSGLHFYGYGAAGGTQLTIRTDGNVGIGTHPYEKLQVDGNVKADGYKVGSGTDTKLLTDGGGTKLITDFADSSQGAKADTALQSIDKTMVENVLTGVITSHDHNYTTSADVSNLINTAIASVYKPKGNIANKTGLLALTNIKQGDVYNAQSAFTLNGQNVKVGDNIVCLADAATSSETNWDNLGGNIDFAAALSQALIGFSATSGSITSSDTILSAINKLAYDKHIHDNLTALDVVSGTNTGDETAQRIGRLINEATAKTTPVDADMVGLMDSTASNIMKKLSWANIKDTLKTYFDSLYSGLAFSKIRINSTDIPATSSGDTIIFQAGTNITLTPDAVLKKVTIAAAGGGGSAAYRVIGVNFAPWLTALQGNAIHFFGTNGVQVTPSFGGSSGQDLQLNFSLDANNLIAFLGDLPDTIDLWESGVGVSYLTYGNTFFNTPNPVCGTDNSSTKIEGFLTHYKYGDDSHSFTFHDIRTNIMYISSRFWDVDREETIQKDWKRLLTCLDSTEHVIGEEGVYDYVIDRYTTEINIDPAFALKKDVINIDITAFKNIIGACINFKIIFNPAITGPVTVNIINGNPKPINYTQFYVDPASYSNTIFEIQYIIWNGSAHWLYHNRIL